MNRFLTIITALFVLLFAATAFAQTQPDPVILIDAIRSHATTIIVGFAVLTLVWAARFPTVKAYWSKLPTWTQPIVPPVLTMLAGIGDALMSGRPLLDSMLLPILAGMYGLLYALQSPLAPKPDAERTTTPPAA